jgi:hypothetical protein
MADIGSKLGYKVEVAELPRGTFISFLLEGVNERFVFSENGEVTCF